ncbi:MAG TPA: cyanophycin synthetase [Thermomicrobiales bacterium]|jgi:cyanophycin synthetase|nr:cyanophycin synthetase [Thermomicrobiales bacterium]
MIELRETRVYHGPSIWARVPALRMRVLIAEGRRTTDQTPDLADDLLRIAPDLMAVDIPGSASHRLIEDIRQGTCTARLIGQLVARLQRLSGARVRRSYAQPARVTGEFDVICEVAQGDIGRAAGDLAIRLLNHILAGTGQDFAFLAEFEERVLIPAERLAFGPSTAAIVDEAERRGIPVLRLDPTRSLIQLGQGRYQKRIWSTLTSATSDLAVDVAGDKQLTNQVLREVGIPVPDGQVVTDVDRAVAVARRIGYPVVLKPLDGNQGRGVGIDLRDETAVRSHFPVARAESREGNVIVERCVTGTDYRVLVIDYQIVAVAERTPAHVIGDGRHTVAELITTANTDPRRGVAHEKVLTRIPVNAQTVETLGRQGLTLESVPESGQSVQLMLTANMSTGGTSIDRTGVIHPDNAEMAREAAMAVGLDIAGIDFVCPDISRSIRETGGAIVEVNAGPGFRMHTHPTEGTPQPVGEAVIDMLFRPDQPTRIPLVAVTGTNGKTTTARMIAHIARSAGGTVGLTTTDGIYVNESQIAAGDMAGPGSARMVLKHPRVDFAVLETARGGLLRSGLGFDRCDVAVVTNVSSDHLGLGEIDTLEDLARVKGVVPASVFSDGVSVLNAEDAMTPLIAQNARGEIVLFSMDEGSPALRDHLRDHGRAVVLCQSGGNEQISLIENGREVTVIAAREIPATAGGRIRVNIANALAATAAAIGAGIDIPTIRNAFYTFGSGFRQTPGRFNLLTIEGREVVMDYGHNVGALTGVADFIARSTARQTTGVIASPGDRREEDMRAFGELAGRTFDQLVIREDSKRRGRAEGEVAAILREAAIQGGMAPDRITVVLDELAAAHRAIDLSRPGDLVVVLVDSVNEVWHSLAARAEQNEPAVLFAPPVLARSRSIAAKCRRRKDACRSPRTRAHLTTGIIAADGRPRRGSRNLPMHAGPFPVRTRHLSTTGSGMPGK